MPEENRGKYSAKSMSFALSDNYWGNGPLSRLPNNKPKSTGLNSALKSDIALRVKAQQMLKALCGIPAMVLNIRTVIFS